MFGNINTVTLTGSIKTVKENVSSVGKEYLSIILIQGRHQFNLRLYKHQDHKDIIPLLLEAKGLYVTVHGSLISHKLDNNQMFSFINVLQIAFDSSKIARLKLKRDFSLEPITNDHHHS